MNHPQAITQEKEVSFQDFETEALSAAVVHDKLQTLQSTKIQELMKRENELIERVQALAEIPDANERTRQEAIIEADLKSVRAERVKHQEDIGALATELFALYDELGMQTTAAGKDAQVDITKRQNAQDAVKRAMEAVASAKAAKTAAEDHWWPFGKDTKVDNADTALKRVGATQKTAEAKVAEVEAQLARGPACDRRNEDDRVDDPPRTGTTPVTC